MTATEYVNKMKLLAYEMAAAGKPLGEDELCASILLGLDMEYNPLVSALVAQVELVSFTKLQSQLMSFESRLEL